MDPLAFFSTVAPVSIAATGLALVALASDKDSRSFWYGRRSRAILANLVFLVLVSPGFISLGSLIQPEAESYAWPIAAACIGGINIWVAFLANTAITDEFEIQEFLKINEELSDLKEIPIAVGGLLILLSIGRFYNSALALVGLEIVLILCLFGGAFSVLALLRTYEKRDSLKISAQLNSSGLLAPVRRTTVSIFNKFLVAVVVVIGMLASAQLIIANQENASIIIQAITAVFVGFTLIVYYRQLNVFSRQLQVMRGQLQAAQHGIDAQNMLDLIDFLQAAYIREARSFVFDKLANTNINDWDEKEKYNASTVCSSYGVAGVVLKSVDMSIEPFLQNWGHSIVKTHRILEPYIAYMRRPDKAGPTYWETYDWLYEQVLLKYPNIGVYAISAVDADLAPPPTRTKRRRSSTSAST